MRSETPLAVIARRKWIIIVTVVALGLVTAVVSKSLTKIYATESTLFITLPSNNQTFDTVQASQAIARSYQDIISNPNIAQIVAGRLGGNLSKQQIIDSTSFDVVPETQLLKIHAEDEDAQVAKRIADTYAAVFIDYAKAQLSATTKGDVSLAASAPVPTSAARPKPTLYTLVAILFGLGLGLALAFLRDRLDRRLRTADDVEAAFDVTVLARVPRRGRSETSRFAFKEAFRILRTNVQFARPAGRLRSVAVTSWSAGEGKTTAAAQLAITSAETGTRTIVVEADFRRPALARELLGSDTTLMPGLTNYLVEGAELDEVIHPTSLPNISIVPAGPVPPSPSALLEAPRGQTLVDDLLEYADYIVFDCPPLSVGAEAGVISTWSDGVLLIVDLASASDRAVSDGLRRLEAVQADLIGLVLNRDRTLEPSAYAYYGPGGDARHVTDGMSAPASQPVD
ncbi:MAG: tyrosine-protein kinase [Thermoleophilaceae bacterium]|jgi:capsular exopolysaccharide synthesis family protein|nr:tyrosine-protein kinase [Thermoleophilaceae bacterium]